jgi:hypothetical protein
LGPLFWLVWLRGYQSCLSFQRSNSLYHWFFCLFLVSISLINILTWLFLSAS